MLKKWFTLIELLVIIAILSVLSTVALVTFTWVTMKSRIAYIKSNIQTAHILSWAIHKDISIWIDNIKCWEFITEWIYICENNNGFKYTFAWWIHNRNSIEHEKVIKESDIWDIFYNKTDQIDVIEIYSKLSWESGYIMFNHFIKSDVIKNQFQNNLTKLLLLNQPIDSNNKCYITWYDNYKILLSNDCLNINSNSTFNIKKAINDSNGFIVNQKIKENFNKNKPWIFWPDFKSFITNLWSEILVFLIVYLLATYWWIIGIKKLLGKTKEKIKNWFNKKIKSK